MSYDKFDENKFPLLAELKQYLPKNNYDEGVCYIIGGLGGGECHGIDYIDGEWQTYYSERGEKNGLKNHSSEAEAVREFAGNIIGTQYRDKAYELIEKYKLRK